VYEYIILLNIAKNRSMLVCISDQVRIFSFWNVTPVADEI